MSKLTIEQIVSLELEAEQNDGRCSHCTQTIKIYRYTVNKTVAAFMRAIADEASKTGVNDVDISTIGIPYSTRTQVSKIRQHGLIARVKDERNVQIPSRWLVTTKGWNFVNGRDIPARVVVFNNQVLGHDGGTVTIHSVMGERRDPNAPLYIQTPVSEAEARTYNNVRTPLKRFKIHAKFKGYGSGLKQGSIHELEIERMVVGQPIKLLEPIQSTYKDIARFQNDWEVVQP